MAVTARYLMDTSDAAMHHPMTQLSCGRGIDLRHQWIAARGTF